MPAGTLSTVSAVALLPVSKFARSARPPDDPASTTYEAGASPPPGAAQTSVTRAPATVEVRPLGAVGATSAATERSCNDDADAPQSAGFHEDACAKQCHGTVEATATGAAAGGLVVSGADGAIGEALKLSQPMAAIATITQPMTLPVCRRRSVFDIARSVPRSKSPADRSRSSAP